MVTMENISLNVISNKWVSLNDKTVKIWCITYELTQLKCTNNACDSITANINVLKLKFRNPLKYVLTLQFVNHHFLYKS